MLSRRHALLGLSVLVLTGAAAAQQPAGAAELVTADGVRIHYLVRGSGPPLVLLHGFALSAELNWIGPGAVDSLATAFTVIVPDLRGHGQSDKPHDPASYGARFVDDVVALLDHLKISKAHVAGYSLGGSIALKLVTTHPDRVRSAVLGGAGWRAPGDSLPVVGLWLGTLERAARDHSSIADALLPPGAPPLPAAARAVLDRNDAVALIAVLRSVAALTVPEHDIETLGVPIHAVVGELDDGARRHVDALRRVAPQVTVTIIPGADHRLAMSHPDLASAIRAFAMTH